MRILLYSFLAISFLICGSIKAQEYSYASRCEGKQDCLENPACLCYCSRMCGYREKEPNDDPVYVPDDPNGYFCYCKQWDLDAYEQRCAEKSSFKPEQIGGVKGF